MSQMSQSLGYDEGFDDLINNQIRVFYRVSFSSIPQNKCMSFGILKVGNHLVKQQRLSEPGSLKSDQVI